MIYGRPLLITPRQAPNKVFVCAIDRKQKFVCTCGQKQHSAFLLRYSPLVFPLIDP